DGRLDRTSSCPGRELRLLRTIVSSGRVRTRTFLRPGTPPRVQHPPRSPPRGGGGTSTPPVGGGAGVAEGQARRVRDGELPTRAIRGSCCIKTATRIER